MTGSSRAPRSAIGIVSTDCGRIVNPWNAAGVDSPASVAKTRSTTAASSYGLVSTNVSMLPSTVKPSARYHSSEVLSAQGETESPAGCCARCSTNPRPPSISTTTLANGAVTKASTSMVVRDHGSTTSDSVAPTPSGVRIVKRPTSCSSLRFATTTSPPTPSSPVAGTPGQNQLPVSAALSLTAGIQAPAGVAKNASGVVGSSRPTTISAAKPTNSTISAGMPRRFMTSPRWCCSARRQGPDHARRRCRGRGRGRGRGRW